MTKKARSERRQHPFFNILRKLLFSWFALTIAWVLIYRFVNPPLTWLMIERSFERVAEGKSWKLEKEWRSFDDLSNNLKRAAIAGEDANFMHHWGFDLKAIRKAYLKNKQGNHLRGGSTISQQVAKNVFLWQGRSWIRKGFEAYFTVLIEILWGKKRILEVYLNVIEMGDGLYGAQAATTAYYHKSAGSLTKGEAALLIAILPNPLKWSPRHPTRYVYLRQQQILRNMPRLGDLNF